MALWTVTDKVTRSVWVARKRRVVERVKKKVSLYGEGRRRIAVIVVHCSGCVATRNFLKGVPTLLGLDIYVCKSPFWAYIYLEILQEFWQRLAGAVLLKGADIQSQKSFKWYLVVRNSSFKWVKDNYGGFFSKKNFPTHPNRVFFLFNPQVFFLRGGGPLQI